MSIWKRELADYWDVDYIIDGITYGFKVGITEHLNEEEEKLCQSNMYIDLTKDERRAITEWVVKGAGKGYIVGPFDLDFKLPFKLHVSPIIFVDNLFTITSLK